MTVCWISPRLTVMAREGSRFDPGTGSDRYARARDWLEGSGHQMAVAAFTFDPDEAGSVVVVPGAKLPHLSGRGPSGGTEDDGLRDWEVGFGHALDAIANGIVEKIVLARRVECVFGEAIDPVPVLIFLTHDNPGIYSFLVDGLVGASPELLVGVDDGRVESLALAGTAGSRRELHGAKVDLEHRLTADSVQEALTNHVHRVRSVRSAHRFGELVHEGTRFEGILRPGSGILDLLADLHPTPAVAGVPSEAAMNLIRTLEKPRGRYAGPVGWFDIEGNGEFAIALRCGQIDGKRIVLHAGGGLVPGSTRDAEWAETELKLAPMRRALDLEN